MAVKTSAAFTKAVMKPGRDLTLSMVIGPSKQTFDVANVLSLEIIESATSKKGVKIGQFCKNECKLTVLATAYDDWQGNTFQLYIKLAGVDDNVSLGKYWAYEVNTDDNYKTVVTAYDIPSWWAEAYSIKDTSVSAILATMESKSGQTITNKSLLTLTSITEVPEKATNQDMLAYIAGYDGYSVRTDRNGNLELYRYELPKQYGLFPSDTLFPNDKLYPTERPNVTQSDIDDGLVISQDRIFQSGLKVDKNTTDINSVTVSNGTDNYTFGNGYGITYYNPYIKSAEQANKCAAYIGFRYSAMTVKYIGNPALQAGDTIMVEVAPDVYSMCLIMEQKISFDGGLGITIDCYSDEADTLAIGTESPTMKKVEARYNELQTLIADMTKTLMGSERGYYRLLAADFDNTGGVSGYHTLKKGEDPAGFRIMNTPDYTSTTHGWQFTLQGLWYSNDGFKSFTNDDVGLTMDGKLLANLIRANSIIGGVIRDLKGLNYWNLDTGEFHLSAGTKVGDSTIANKADISASSEAITTSVSKTYTTKADAQSLADTAEANAKSDTAEKLKDYSTTVEMQSAIKQQADSITASVSKTYQTMDGMSSYTKKAEIIADINGDTSEVKISADKIEFSGSATFTSAVEDATNSMGYTTDFDLTQATADMVTGYMLKTKGQTIINGDNITTGTINCNLLNGGIIKGQVIQGGTIKTTSLTFGDTKYSITLKDCPTETFADGREGGGAIAEGNGWFIAKTNSFRVIDYSSGNQVLYTYQNHYITMNTYGDDGTVHSNVWAAGSSEDGDYSTAGVSVSNNYTQTLVGVYGGDGSQTYKKHHIYLGIKHYSGTSSNTGTPIMAQMTEDGLATLSVNSTYRIYIDGTASEFHAPSGKQMFKVADDRIGLLQSSNDKKTWRYIFWASYDDGGFHIFDWNSNTGMWSDGSELHIKAKDTNGNYSSYRVRWVWLDNHWVLCAN